LLINLLLGFLLLFVIALFFTMVLHLFILKVPYVPTPARVAQAMVQLARLRGSEKIYDLGAGDGAILIAAKRAHPGVTAIGIELVPTIWLLGWLRILLSRVSIQFRLQSALKTDIRDADVIFLYVTPFLMQQLEPKFDRELRKGTVVISHTFRFASHKPIEEKNISGMLGQHRIFRYEW
jgi:hypothetical protein